MLSVHLPFPTTHQALKNNEIEYSLIFRAGQERAREAAEQQERARFGAHLMGRLRNSWKDKDPGKYNAVVFLLDKNNRQVLAEELLDPKIKRYTEEEWKTGQYIRGSSYDGIRPELKVIALAQVQCVSCPNCSNDHPVLERYHQSEDGPDGDTWSKARFVICENGGNHYLIASKESPHRF